MYSILLAVIYAAFISLGLPDSLLGSAWPVIHREFDVPTSYAGIVTFIIALGTIVSSLNSDRLTRKLGASWVTTISVAMTAAALFGFSSSHAFVWLCIWAIPYGLGAGAVDAALNNYVALHYAARHMSWLHSFWGVGAAIGPIIMGWVLGGGRPWNNGYAIIGVIQIVLTVSLLVSTPLWKRSVGTDSPQDAGSVQERVDAAPVTLRQSLQIPGVPLMLTAFFGYCAFESTAMLWGSTFLAQYRDVDTATASRFASLFLLGLTAGRFLSGFVADRLGDRRIIRIGIGGALLGALMVTLPLQSNTLALAGLVVAGFGAAPIYPAIIHSTPANFGARNSQAVIGIQMASAYLGTTLMPPLFGIIAGAWTLGLFPFFLLLMSAITLVMTEKLNATLDARRAAS